MLWRISPSRSRRTPPAGFISPARPLLTSKLRSGPEWVHEIKFDGYRLIARKDAGRVVLWSRYATDYSDTFSRIAEARAVHGWSARRWSAPCHVRIYASRHA
jgi:ATP-dependent DNA ligase